MSRVSHLFGGVNERATGDSPEGCAACWAGGCDDPKPPRAEHPAFRMTPNRRRRVALIDRAVRSDQGKVLNEFLTLLRRTIDLGWQLEDALKEGGPLLRLLRWKDDEWPDSYPPEDMVRTLTFFIEAGWYAHCTITSNMPAGLNGK